jgi:hypothetical protein
VVNKGKEVKDGEDNGRRQGRIIEVYRLAHLLKNAWQLFFKKKKTDVRKRAWSKWDSDKMLLENTFSSRPSKLYIFSLHQ